MLIDVTGVMCVQCAVQLCASCRGHAHTHRRTPLHLPALSSTHMQTKREEKGTKEKIKWPARVLMREDRASGIHLKPFLPPAALSGGLSVSRPLTAEAWISCQIRVKAQQESCALVPKWDHFQVPCLSRHIHTHSICRDLNCVSGAWYCLYSDLIVPSGCVKPFTIIIIRLLSVASLRYSNPLVLHRGCTRSLSDVVMEHAMNRLLAPFSPSYHFLPLGLI